MKLTPNKWEDTVMKYEELQQLMEEKGYDTGDGCPFATDSLRETIAKAQAEISFKAGAKAQLEKLSDVCPDCGNKLEPSGKCARAKCVMARLPTIDDPEIHQALVDAGIYGDDDTEGTGRNDEKLREPLLKILSQAFWVKNTNRVVSIHTVTDQILRLIKES